MDLKGLLNQALNSDIVKQGTEQLKQGSSSLGNMAKENKSNLTAFGAGAVGGGLLGVLMGSKKAKKMGKKALGVGSAAALGALAYKLYNDYQGGGDSGTGQSQPQQPEAMDENLHSTLILKAMIAAAKADGHVDDEEQAKIEQAITEMGADDSVRSFVQTELNKPLDPSEIANSVSSPQQATEIYLATLLVVDEQNFMEKAYLKELASQLNLEEDLVLQLEAQITQ